MGVKRITLSYELNQEQIRRLISDYYNRYKKHPNLELIVKGYEEVMVSKFSLNKYYQQDNLSLRDIHGNKYKIKDKNGYMYIYNKQERNIFNKDYYDMGINALRINYD